MQHLNRQKIAYMKCQICNEYIGFNCRPVTSLIAKRQYNKVRYKSKILVAHPECLGLPSNTYIHDI